MTLDKDGDGYLDRAEYKELKRLVKKAVKPKKCAHTFARTCDLNHDLKLSRQEWGACLANDFTRKFLYVYICARACVYIYIYIYIYIYRNIYFVYIRLVCNVNKHKYYKSFFLNVFLR